jgi:chromosomal replication initiation ATPase DnaA
MTSPTLPQPILPHLLADVEAGPWFPITAAAAAHASLGAAENLVVCLYGPHGCGKSHLLAQAAARGRRVWDDLEQAPHAAQTALFHALQAASQGGVPVAVASRVPVAQLKNLLPDVQSRLLLGPQLEVGLPTDAELRALWQHWAQARQLSLPAAVTDYVLARAARNPGALHEFLVRLDSLSLAERRAITVPLVRQVLEK